MARFQFLRNAAELILHPLGRSVTRGRGQVIGSRFALDEYQSRLTAGVFAVTAYLARGFELADAVTEVKRGEVWERDSLDAFEMLRERPNAINALSDILVSAAVDTAAHGTGYVEMVMIGSKVGGLWWCPTSLTSVEYETGGTDIRLYRSGGRPTRGTRDIAPEAMIRIQRGISFESPAEGMSPLAVLGEAVGADQRLMRALSAALHNSARADVVMPSNGQEAWNDDETEGVADLLREQATESNYGKLIAAPDRLEVVHLGRDLRQGPLGEAQMLTETRIAAAFGIPVQVLSVYTSRLNRAAADLEAARKVVFESVLKPVGTEVADGLTRHLLPALGAGPEWRVRMDWSQHPIAAAEQREHVAMLRELHREGIVSARQVAEAAGVEYDGAEE